MPSVKTVPFISQMATLPLVSRQRISALPVPRKSPIPAIAQLAAQHGYLVVDYYTPLVSHPEDFPDETG